MASLISSLTFTTLFLLLRHLYKGPPRGNGNPLRTTSKSRLLFKYTSNTMKTLSLMTAYNCKQKEWLRGCNRWEQSRGPAGGLNDQTPMSRRRGRGERHLAMALAAAMSVALQA